MTTWGLVVETTVGAGERKHIEAYVVAHITGSRADALAELERIARRHSPEHPRSPKRRRLLRDGDGFLLVIDGAWQSFVTRFSVAELLEDSDGPVVPGPAEDPSAVPPGPAGEVPAAPASGPVAEDVERYADGVPVKPAWLGRDDLP
ncbi:hypothetical protein JK361_36425 [Streptomyces sp. 5-8]|uniref:Uncharacterized protein n=1 Tax=Streptomyces musisoli TaxID=2802280 RepID=A0ABS1PCB1_9ACTN|nr:MULTISPECIES: hypothetical protein [Streptomyces]MBL1109988.1 hypothetical protein [Streptomyces musisoli]MBY8841391.1 hypothetical protein [Streptomyces sp. SP2-10]